MKARHVIISEVPGGAVLATAISPITEEINEMVFDVAMEDFFPGYEDFIAGRALIQDALPMLSPDEREFLLTGLTPQQWDTLFREEEEV